MASLQSDLILLENRKGRMSSFFWDLIIIWTEMNADWRDFSIKKFSQRKIFEKENENN
jgi:hypothetical protein